MSNKRRFLKLDRQINKSAIWNDGTPFDKAHAWMDLLLYVNYVPSERIFGNTIVHIKRGQIVTSDNFLANRWNWSRNRVRRFLELLEADNMIRLERTSYGTWISIVNYTKYQGEWTANGTSNDTTVGTSNGTSNGTQSIEFIESIENGGERGQAPRAHFEPSEDFIKTYCDNNGLKINVTRFMAYYGARDWTLGKGMKVERPDQLEKLIDSWATTNVEDEFSESEKSDSRPYYEEFSSGPAIGGDAVPFKGGLAAEMLRRKREKNAR